jgi:nucleobase:cation symporter-1, NCS1 family
MRHSNASNMSRIHGALKRAGDKAKAKTRVSGWELPKQETSYAPDGVWTNIDLDVTPPERRIWTATSVLGYWISDIVSPDTEPQPCCEVE